MNSKDVSLSKSLSWLLRHGAITEGLRVSDEGFIQLEEVLQHRLFARRCTAADIRRVVTLSKNRFTLQSNPKTGIYEIRANSGHTFKDSNNHEAKSELKLIRGRAIPQPGLRSNKNNKNNHQSQSRRAESLKNYNLPIGNIASDEKQHRRGWANKYDKLMKYPELKKALLWILRYGAEKEGLTVKRHGYVPIEQILHHTYFRNKCMREDLITVANNEPHNFKVRLVPNTQQLYIRARKEHPIKEQEDWSVIPDLIYLPRGHAIHGINGTDWEFVSERGIKAPKGGYIYCSPYEPKDSWHTKGVTKYDDIYVYINCYAAMQDGIEFFQTPEYSIATKGDKKGFIGTQYFLKVVEAETGTSKFSPEDLKKIFKKFGEISRVIKQKKQAFAFVQFTDTSSVEKALKARIFAGGIRLFVHKYDENRNKPNANKEKSRKFSDTSSNTSQTELSRPPQLGVSDLPIELSDPELGLQDQNVFEWHAQQLISQVELPADTYQRLDEVKADVENLFSFQLPGCQAIVFGSCGSGLAFKNSDVDLFLLTVGEQPKDFVRKEAKVMYKSHQFNVIARIPNARVPIVKFEHIKTGWLGDLTTNSQLGVCNSQLIRFLISLDPRIRPLVMVIKYWAKVCGVTGSNQQLTTYSLVMLVVFYLQQLKPPVLPTVASLQQLSQQKEFSIGWECSFCDEEWKVQSECLQQPNNLSLRELLTGFFCFYHKFDYNNVICPLLGRTVPVKCFESEGGSDLPEEMFLYKEKLKIDPKCQFKTNVMLRVQDPFELCLNITRNVTDKTFSVFKEACKVSLGLCEKNDDSSLLRSLFSIDEESLDLADNCQKIYIPFKQDSLGASEVRECDIVQWYELTTDAILLVLREIFKLSVEPKNVEVSTKVKKLESSQDVHTPLTNPLNTENKLVYVCCGKADVFNSRKKMSKLMNNMNISISAFEKEVCISNALYHPNDADSFYFTLVISSLETLKKNAKGIEVIINIKKCQNHLIKKMIQSMKMHFKSFILQAAVFINKVKSTSSVTKVKESLKELFNLKLENLPDLNNFKKKEELLGMDSTTSSKKEDEDKVLKQQDLLMKNLNNCNDPDMKNVDTECVSDYCTNTNAISNSERLDDQVDAGMGKNASENYVMPSVCSSKNVPSAETRTLIDEFFKRKSPKEIDALKSSSESSDNSGSDKFSYLLSTIRKIETQSSFTSEETNPFLASIEKVALKSFEIENKTFDEDETNIDKIEDESKTKKIEDETKINQKVNDYKNIKISELFSSGQKKSTDDEKTEIVGKPETSSVDNEIGDEQKSHVKSSHQRPKIYLERPSKQRKPNRCKNDSPRQQCEAWRGSGTQGHKTWPKQSYAPDQPPYTGHGNNDFYRSDRHQRALSKSIERQKGWYPNLFRHNNC